MQRFFRTRVGAFVLFLIVAILPDLLIGGTAYLLLRLHVIHQPEMTWRPTLFLLFEGTTIAGLLIATFIVMKLGGRSLRDLGFAARNAGTLLLAGSAVGIAAPMLLIAVIAALGGFTFGTFAMHGTQLIAYALAWLAAMFALGLAEEMTFRGPALSLLGDAITPWAAAFVTTAIFVFMHAGKPGENAADLTSVGLLGLFMAFTVIRTGSIWFAVGFHTFFDYVALYVLGAPNSGNHGGEPIPTRLLTGSYHGPAWLTGGKLGIEASWLIFPIIALMFATFFFVPGRDRIRQT
ncbi:MAG TPA: CPBP family intramembrane glutamic endopeptidase [Thermoanaerobaculia bacterium]|jgi:membrane protease YdiL (CAAX protease family)